MKIRKLLEALAAATTQAVSVFDTGGEQSPLLIIKQGAHLASIAIVTRSRKAAAALLDIRAKDTALAFTADDLKAQPVFLDVYRQSLQMFAMDEDSVAITIPKTVLQAVIDAAEGDDITLMLGQVQRISHPNIGTGYSSLDYLYRTLIATDTAQNTIVALTGKPVKVKALAASLLNVQIESRTFSKRESGLNGRDSKWKPQQGQASELDAMAAKVRKAGGMEAQAEAISNLFKTPLSADALPEED